MCASESGDSGIIAVAFRNEEIETQQLKRDTSVNWTLTLSLSSGRIVKCQLNASYPRYEIP